jgi:hypothetical protein
LAPGVTIEQFTEFYLSKYKPEFEKCRKGWKIYPVKWIRGMKADGFAAVIVVASEKERDRHYDAEGNLTEYGKAALEKLNQVSKEMKKLATVSNDRYTDWLVY